MSQLTNAELRQAINDTVKNLKPYINGFGHKITVLDEDSIAMLRGHLLELQQEEAKRASEDVMQEPKWVEVPTPEPYSTKLERV